MVPSAESSSTKIASQEIQSSARATRSTRTVMFSRSFRVGITIATLGTAGTAGLRSTEGRPSSRSIWGRTTPIPCGSGSRKMSCPPQQPLRNLRGQTSQKLAGIVIARCSRYKDLKSYLCVGCPAVSSSASRSSVPSRVSICLFCAIDQPRCKG